MTFREVLLEGERLLREAGIADAKADAWSLMERAFGITRKDYLLRMAQQAGKEETEGYRALLARRSERIPLQHILGEAWFCGFPFLVSEDVLIPRPETELLVEQALLFLNGRAEQERRVLDLCTGSGCIAVSIALLCRKAAVEGTDLSGAALAIAMQNARKLGAEVLFHQGDLFAPISKQYDLIVSNPPYICSGEIADLMPEVRDHDPCLALDGGEDGLVFYRRISREAPKHLLPGGGLILEIGHDQGTAVAALLEEAGLTGIRVQGDLAGLDRVVCAVKREERKG